MVPDWLVLPVALIVGSALGVLIRRLPAGHPVGLARSCCDHCGHILSAHELVPIVSFVVQRGRCRSCGVWLGWFYPAIELAALAVALWAVSVDAGPRLWADCVLGWVLLAAAWIDREHFVLPDSLTLPLIPLGIGLAWWENPEFGFACALGAALGYAAFWIVARTYRALRGRVGLGEGDAKLLAVGGAWLGWQALPAVVIVASVLGILMILARRAASRAPSEAFAWSVPVAFGPALAFAIWICRLYLT